MDKQEILGVIKRGDIILVLALVFLSCVLIFSAFIARTEPPAYAVVSVSGETVAVLPIEKNTVLEVGEGERKNTVVVENGEVYILDASCPDKVCVSCGAVSKNGDIILCLPNRLIVRIVSDSPQESDTVSY